MPRARSQRSADVACGVGNVLHNKGGIGAFVKMKARNGDDDRSKNKHVKLLFVVSHLVSTIISMIFYFKNIVTTLLLTEKLSLLTLCYYRLLM